jgi:hypothetical protein
LHTCQMRVEREFERKLNFNFIETFQLIKPSCL